MLTFRRRFSIMSSTLTASVRWVPCLFAIAAMPHAAIAAKSQASVQLSAAYVVVDQREKGFVVFTSLAASMTPKKLSEIRQKVAEADDVSLVRWADFEKNVTQYAKATMLVNDYPQINISDGLLCLLGTKRAMGAPWGLSWNGGIALTYRDYQHVRRSYQRYLKNPATHQAETDPRADPIYPNHHLTFAGCQR